MRGKHFREIGMNSFWGEFVYQDVVPEKHFPRQLNAVIDWGALGKQLIALDAGRGEIGRPPYHPVLLLKMLLLAYLYHLSERQVEEHVQDSLAARWFVGLAVNECVPGHPPLSTVKARMVEQGQTACLEGLLAQIVRQHRHAGWCWDACNEEGSQQGGVAGARGGAAASGRASGALQN